MDRPSLFLEGFDTEREDLVLGERDLDTTRVELVLGDVDRRPEALSGRPSGPLSIPGDIVLSIARRHRDASNQAQALLDCYDLSLCFTL